MKNVLRHIAVTLLAVIVLCACTRTPVLHLHHDAWIYVDLPLTEIELKAVWSYEFDYDFEAEWQYGWDETDVELFGQKGYVLPTGFNLRRYYLGYFPDGKHVSTKPEYVEGNRFVGSFNFGYYDMLSWNQVETLDGVQAINIDETLDEVTAYTHKSMGTKSKAVNYQPEIMFAGYDRNLFISDNPDDYEWNAELNCWHKKIDMKLQPVTYIYLVQLVIHNNRGRLSGVDGSASISGFSEGVTLNTGVTFDSPVAVTYSTRLKNKIEITETGELVDIIGGRLVTFGICNVNPTKVKTKAELPENGDPNLLELGVQFYNGTDSVFVFDVTKQVRERYKGGVITVEIDMDHVVIPHKDGGSGFDAIVKDPEEEEYEIEM